MNRLPAFGLAVMVLVGMLAVAGPAAAQSDTTNASIPSFGETQFVVTVYDNGSARWTQRYNQPLSNETHVQGFRTYADEFNSEETPVYTDFRDRATDLTAAGSNATGRTMSAQGFTRTATVTSQPSTTGVVEMSFLWANFTAPENGQRDGWRDVRERHLPLAEHVARISGWSEPRGRLVVGEAETRRLDQWFRQHQRFAHLLRRDPVRERPAPGHVHGRIEPSRRLVGVRLAAAVGGTRGCARGGGGGGGRCRDHPAVLGAGIRLGGRAPRDRVPERTPDTRRLRPTGPHRTARRRRP